MRVEKERVERKRERVEKECEYRKRVERERDIVEKECE